MPVCRRAPNGSSLQSHHETQLIPRGNDAAWRVLLMPVESQLPHPADSPCGTDELERITLVCKANMKTRFPKISVARFLLLTH